MKGTQRDTDRAALLRAIQIEARNSGVYDSLAHLFQGYDDAVTAIFCEMAAEERRHREELEQRYHERFGALPSGTEEPAEVIEAPDLEDPEALIFDSMTVVQALEAGLRAEENAREFYRREVTRTSDLQLQEVYRELAEFEETHVQRLREKLAEKQDPAKSTSR